MLSYQAASARARTQELEQQQQHPGAELERRRLLEKPGESALADVRTCRPVSAAVKTFRPAGTDRLKSREEQRREKRLTQRLMEMVNGRNAAVAVGLDQDRLRSEAAASPKAAGFIQES